MGIRALHREGVLQARRCVPRFDFHLSCCLLLVVTVNKSADFALVAPLVDVLGRLALDDLGDVSVCEPLALELLDPLGKLVDIPSVGEHKQDQKISSKG